jgi:hypothetical protein
MQYNRTIENRNRDEYEQRKEHRREKRAQRVWLASLPVFLARLQTLQDSSMELDESNVDAGVDSHFQAGDFGTAIRACEDLELQVRIIYAFFRPVLSTPSTVLSTHYDWLLAALCLDICGVSCSFSLLQAYVPVHDRR